MLNTPSDVPFWLTEEWRANLQMLTSGASSVERHSSKAPCPFSCLLVILSVQRCQGRCGVDHALFQWPAWVDHVSGVTYGWAVRVHILFCLGCHEISSMRSITSEVQKSKGKSSRNHYWNDFWIPLYGAKSAETCDVMCFNDLLKNS